MIDSDEEFKSERDQLAHLESIILSLRKELLPHNPKNYLLYAEGAIEMYWKLRLQLDEYLGFHTQIPADVAEFLNRDDDAEPPSQHAEAHEPEAVPAK